MRLVRIIAKIVVIALAFVGAVSLVPYTAPKGAAKAPFGGDVSVHFIPSPDASMKAALVYYTGGGAISPYCSIVVSVLPDTGSETDAQDKKFTVFTGECAGFAVRNGAVLNSPIIEWVSNTTLRITSSINATMLTPVTVTMKKRDASGRVTLQYEAHE
jgi:hypothetical protein